MKQRAAVAFGLALLAAGCAARPPMPAVAPPTDLSAPSAGKNQAILGGGNSDICYNLSPQQRAGNPLCKGP